MKKLFVTATMFAGLAYTAISLCFDSFNGFKFKVSKMESDVTIYCKTISGQIPERDSDNVVRMITLEKPVDPDQICQEQHYGKAYKLNFKVYADPSMYDKKTDVEHVYVITITN